MEPCVVLENQVVVGQINLDNIVRGPFQSASIGYWLDKEAVGRGLATAAVDELVERAFGDLGLHRVHAGALPHDGASPDVLLRNVASPDVLLRNVASPDVLLRNGFERFGFAPRYLAIAGEYADHILFQRLAE